MHLQQIGTLLHIAATCDKQGFVAAIVRLLERVCTVAVMTPEPNRRLATLRTGLLSNFVKISKYKSTMFKLRLITIKFLQINCNNWQETTSKPSRFNLYQHVLFTRQCSGTDTVSKVLTLFCQICLQYNVPVVCASCRRHVSIRGCPVGGQTTTASP